jgi:hypothetical protein
MKEDPTIFPLNIKRATTPVVDRRTDEATANCAAVMRDASGGLHRRSRILVDKFVAHLNIKHFCRQLAEDTNETRRLMLARLLAEEEAKLATLTSRPKGMPG